MTTRQFAKHLDMAAHQPNLTTDEVRQRARIARDLDVAAFYTNTYWTSLVANELHGSSVRVGAAVGFPLGNGATDAKITEVDVALRDGATSVDMVLNIGAWKEQDITTVRSELEQFVDRCTGRALTKLIFEVAYLSDSEVARLTHLCCDVGVDYVKTATGPDTAPTEEQVRILLDNVTGTTKVKVSGIPRTFPLASCLWMLDRGVDLIGTGKAADLIRQFDAEHAIASNDQP